MATLANSSSSTPPPYHGRRRSFARKCERFCCSCISFFPLVVVYALTTWAVWVQASIGFLPSKEAWTGKTSAFVGIILYLLLNWSYTTAVFVDPGSPLTPTKDAPYSVLPSTEMPHAQDLESGHAGPTLTVKSTGEMRFCKKCQTRKPDRAHHCSTCRRCVLKMDHHCPWLATCVGLRNYKAFLLFLIYTSIFCWVCAAVSITWVWSELLDQQEFADRLMPINYVLLAVMAGIIGLVLTGFTAWHIWLACCGQTTIESLEKQRYLTPLKRSLATGQDQRRNYIGASEGRNPGANENQSFVDQLRTIHANALPGITRPEEGEELPSTTPPPLDNYHNTSNSPAHNSLRQIHHNGSPSTYRDLEHQRERDRYAAYQAELESEKLPNAFDLGWRRNLLHLMGENPWLRWLPICNTTGDGWNWETSQKWHEASQSLAREREARARENEAFERDARETRARWQQQGPPYGHISSSGGVPLRTFTPQHPGTVDEGADDSDSSDDGSERKPLQHKPKGATTTSNWNDIPEDFVDASRSRSRGSQRAMQNG